MAFWDRFGKKKTPQEYMAAGNLKAALKGFLEQAGSKTDPVLFMQIADIYKRLKKMDEAREYYIKVGEYYGDRGFFNKSVAAFKRALNISPNDKEILDKLAGYNDKVPKFMINEKFIRQARGEEKPKAEATPEPAAPTPTPEPTPQPQAAPEVETTPEFATAPEPEPEPEPMAPRAEAEPIAAAPEAEAEPEVVEEEEEDVAFIDDETFEEGDIPEDFDELYDSGDTSKDEPQPVDDPEPVPEDSARAAAKIEGEGGMVFKTTNTAPSQRDQIGMDFHSFDDAVDTLFSGPGEGGGGLFDFGGGNATDEEEPEVESPAADEPSQDIDNTGAIRMEEVSQEENAKHWPLFRTMPKEVFTAFIVALDTKDFDPGSDIVRQGDPGDEMYLIAEGQVEVIINQNGVDTPVAKLGEGDFFGEASLLTGAPRNATIRTLTEVYCLLLNQADLRELTRSHPSVMASIESIYYTRQQQNAARK